MIMLRDSIIKRAAKPFGLAALQFVAPFASRILVTSKTKPNINKTILIHCEVERPQKIPLIESYLKYSIMKRSTEYAGK